MGKIVVMMLGSVALAVGMLFFGSYTGITTDVRKAKAQTAPKDTEVIGKVVASRHSGV